MVYIHLIGRVIDEELISNNVIRPIAERSIDKINATLPEALFFESMDPDLDNSVAD